jgi:hypothetical protein
VTAGAAQIARQRVKEDETGHAQGHLEKPVAPGEFDEWTDGQDRGMVGGGCWTVLTFGWP